MYLLGIDIGSSSEKVAVFDLAGNLMQLAKSEYPIYSEQEGWAEQDAEDYYAALLQNLKQIDRTYLALVRAVCICGQTPTDIFVDKNGKPLRRAIMWRDTRAKNQLERQKQKYSFEELEKMSGCPIPKSENWTTLRMAWVKEEEPLVAQNIDKVLQPKDYLIHRLSGTFATDLWSARCFANVQTGVVNEDLLNFFGFDKKVVPPIYKVADVCAEITNEEVAALGLKKGTKIICGSSDGFAAMISSGLFSEDDIAFNSAGTSEMAGISIQDEKGAEGLYVFPRSLTAEKAVCFGPTQSGGASLLWMANNVLKIDFQQLIEYAKQSPAGSNGLIFLPYINGERAPIWDGNAKGSFFGVKSSHTICDFARSVLEGVAFSIRSLLKAREDVSIGKLRLLGGGSQVPLWCQIRADVLQTEVEVVECKEACAQGAATLAGIGCGVYASYRDAALKTCKVGATYTPRIETKESYDKNYRIYRALYEQTKDLMKEI